MVGGLSNFDIGTIRQELAEVRDELTRLHLPAPGQLAHAFGGPSAHLRELAQLRLRIEGQGAIFEVSLHPLRELQQSKVCAHRPDPFHFRFLGDRLVGGQVVLLGHRLPAAGLGDGVERLAMVVLGVRDLGAAAVERDRDLLLAGDRRGLEATFARQQVEEPVLVGRRDDQRLDHADVGDAVGERLKRLGVLELPRVVVRLDADAADVDFGSGEVDCGIDGCCLSHL